MERFVLAPTPDWDALDRVRAAFEATPTVETEAALARALVPFLARAEDLARYASRLGGRPAAN